MPSLEEHCMNDLDLGLSRAYPEIHTLLDQFAHYPDMRFLQRHRKFLHHEEGIEYITMRYGEEAGRSARQHVMDDCGHVPHAIDYYRGNVDVFGQKIQRHWSQE